MSGEEHHTHNWRIEYDTANLVPTWQQIVRGVFEGRGLPTFKVDVQRHSRGGVRVHLEYKGLPPSPWTGEVFEQAGFEAAEQLRGAWLARHVTPPLPVPAAAPSVPALYRPSNVARITFQNRLAEGNDGEVWIAVEDDLDRRVAVKLFHDDAPDGPTALEHAKALAKVKHDNVIVIHRIARVLDPRSNDGKTCDAVIMELVDGEALGDRMRLGRAFTAGEAERVGNAILDGLEAIHEQGLQHGDLHDGNVLLWGDGRVRIIDIVYRGSLRYLSTTTRTQRLAHDQDDAYRLISDVMLHSEMPLDAEARFRREAQADRSLALLRAGFRAASAADGPAPSPASAPDAARAPLPQSVGRLALAVVSVVLGETPSRGEVALSIVTAELDCSGHSKQEISLGIRQAEAHGLIFYDFEDDERGKAFTTVGLSKAGSKFVLDHPQLFEIGRSG